MIVWRTPAGRSGRRDKAVERGTRSQCGPEGCNRAVRMGKRIGVGVLADSRISAKTSVTGSAYLHGSDLVEGPMFHSEGYDVLIQHLIKKTSVNVTLISISV